jgi:hypothetical protein
MRANLLTFLFGDTVARESSKTLGEEVLRLFEEAADEETEEMVACKEPLATALKSLDIDGEVIVGPHCACLHCKDGDEYRKYTGILFDPEKMHVLASKGWVAARTGDEAMTFEPASYRISFIELATSDLSTTDKVPDAEKIRKDAQKFASTEVDHDDDNPVEFDDKSSSNGQKGVGKAADGKDPEGKPKGSTKQTESQRRIQELGGGWCAKCKLPYDTNIGCPGCGAQWAPVDHSPEIKARMATNDKKRCQSCGHPSAVDVAESLLEMTGTGSMGAFEGPPPAKANWQNRLDKLRKRRGAKRDAKTK